MNDDSMQDDSIDLSSLDPTRNAARFDAVARGVARDAMLARVRRPMVIPDIFTELASCSRPALLAAALVLAVALPTLAHSRLGPAAPAGRAASAADIIGIPRQLTDLLRSSSTPSLVELHDALASADGGGR